MPKVIQYSSRDTFYLGIDPGLSGGAALIDANGNTSQGLSWLLEFKKCSEHDIASWIRQVVEGRIVKAALEKVWAMKGQGVSSMFTFGRGYGFIRGLLCAYRIPFEEPIAATWQKEMGVPTKKKEMSKPDHKKLLRAKAQRIFAPQAEYITLGNCDALLIAEWLRRRNECTKDIEHE